MSTYPARLEFDLTDEKTAGDVIQAARDLQIPFEVDSPQRRIVVVVDSAMTAYQFGIRTGELRRRRLQSSAARDGFSSR